MSQLLRVDLHGHSAGRAACSEIFLFHRGDAHGAIDVGHICDVGYIHDGDVVVLYMNDFGLMNVGDVDLVDVLRAAGIPRLVGFSWTERKPDGDSAAPE